MASAGDLFRRKATEAAAERLGLVCPERFRLRVFCSRHRQSPFGRRGGSTCGATTSYAWVRPLAN